MLGALETEAAEAGAAALPKPPKVGTAGAAAAAAPKPKPVGAAGGNWLMFAAFAGAAADEAPVVPNGDAFAAEDGAPKVSPRVPMRAAASVPSRAGEGALTAPVGVMSTSDWAGGPLPVGAVRAEKLLVPGRAVGSGVSVNAADPLPHTSPRGERPAPAAALAAGGRECECSATGGTSSISRVRRMRCAA